MLMINWNNYRGKDRELKKYGLTPSSSFFSWKKGIANVEEYDLNIYLFGNLTLRNCISKKGEIKEGSHFTTS